MSKQNRDDTVWRWSSEIVSHSGVQFTVLVTVKTGATILLVWDCIIIFFFLLHFHKKLDNLNPNMAHNIYSNPPRPVWYMQVLLGTEKKGVLIHFWCIRLFMRSSTLLYISNTHSFWVSGFGKVKKFNTPLLNFLRISYQVFRSCKHTAAAF